MNERYELLAAKLKDTGYRMTPQRVAILKVLAQSDTHLRVEEIFDAVQTDFPMTSLATVYKTIATLKEIGEVNEIKMADGSSRIDGRSPEPHPHLICLDCGEILDANMENLKRLTDHLDDGHEYLIKGYRLDFFGICPKCQKDNNHRDRT